MGHKRLFSWLLSAAFILVFALVICVVPWHTQNANAEKTDFKVFVGYYGGPYYEKKVYTWSDMEALMQSGSSKGLIVEYTLKDKGDYLRKSFARGVYLDELLKDAGVDKDSVQTFYFVTADKYESEESGTQQWTKDALLGTKRYYYRYYMKYYDFKEKEIPEDYYDMVESNKKRVKTMIALYSTFERIYSNDDKKWTDSSGLNTSNATAPAYRVVFGQTSPNTKEAHWSAKYVYQMRCILGGAPTVKFNKDSLEGEVGSVLTVKVTVGHEGEGNGDELVEKEALKDVKVKSDDKSIAEVIGYDKKTGTAKILIKGKGKVKLTASYETGKMTAKDTTSVSGSQKEIDTSGAGDGFDGDGNGSGNGSGNGGGASGSNGGTNSGGSSSATPSVNGNKQVNNSTGNTTNFYLQSAKAGLTSGSKGGVQNWRLTEGTFDSELGEEDVDPKLMLAIVIFALILLLIGIALQTGRYCSQKTKDKNAGENNKKGGMQHA